MIINYITGKTCVARVYDRFPVNHQGWEVRAAGWINRALNEINIPCRLEKATVPVTLSEYKCRIPDKTAYIRAMSWNGLRVDRLGGTKVNRDPVEDIPNLQPSEYWYDLDKNGYIISNLPEGECKLYIFKYLDDYDSETHAWYPRVPDNEEVLNALDWFILKSILERGNLVKGYSLSDNNPFTNPAMAWEKAKKSARNTANSLDSEERELLSRLIRSFVIDYNDYTQGEFNPYTYET